MSLTPYKYMHLPHGDPIISGADQWDEMLAKTQDKLSRMADRALASMAETEKQDKRPSCGWKVKEKQADGSTKERLCGSEERVYKYTGQGKYTGRTRQTDICEKHIPDAIREWNYHSAIPVDTMPHKP